jgi:cobalamin-dependent methionine synthase I
MNKTNVIDIPVNIKEEDLLKRINTKKSGKVSERMKKLITNAVKLIEKDAEGKAVYSIQPLNDKGNNLLINNKIEIKSRKLFKIFKACSRVLVFVSTIGEKIEKKIKKNMNENPAYGYVLDQAASLAAESAAEYLQNYISKNSHDDDFDTTLRYSPGYCDWHIKEQKNLFKIIDGGQIGVKLSDSAYMTPRKSVSGIIGLCSNPGKGFTGSACKYCSNNKCPYRRS